MKRYLRVIRLVIFFWLLFGLWLPQKAEAQFIEFQPQKVEDTTSSRNGVILTYENFFGSSMKDVYSGMMGIHFERVMWEWKEVGLRFGGGVIGSNGSARVIDPSWTITSNDIGFWALDLEASLLYRFSDSNPFKTITPFAGVGLDIVGAIEKLSTTMQKDSAGSTRSTIRGDASALRSAVGVHALLGIYIPIEQDNAVQIELKGILSSESGYDDLLSSDEKATFNARIYPVLQRPSFTLTGVSLGVAFFL